MKQPQLSFSENRSAFGYEIKRERGVILSKYSFILMSIKKS